MNNMSLHMNSSCMNLYDYCTCEQGMHYFKQTSVGDLWVDRPKFCIYVILHKLMQGLL